MASNSFTVRFAGSVLGMVFMGRNAPPPAALPAPSPTLLPLSWFSLIWKNAAAELAGKG
jgi:hypothetical protein